MAKQNFLAGGFYGKLGATVGQRWRNKRTLRVYVKTPNPDTPAQQANRGAFARAIKAAQQALVFNKGTQAFYTEGMTEFQYRTSVAKQRIDSGLTGFAVLPLFPDSYTPSVTITELSYSLASGGKYRFSSATYPSASQARSLVVCLSLVNTATGAYEDIRVAVTLSTESTYLFELSLPAGYTIGEESTIYGVSNDDTEYSDTMVYIPMQTCGGASEVVVDDFAPTGYEGQYALFTSEKISAIGQYMEFTLTGTAVNGLNLSQSGFSNHAVYDPSKDQYIRMYLADPLTMASGAQVTGGTCSTSVPGYAVTVGESAQSTDTVKRWWEGADNPDFEITYNTTEDTGGNASIYIYSQYGQGLGDGIEARGTYPYRTASGKQTATLSKAGSADRDGATGLNAEIELLVTESYPEQYGDKIDFEYIGVGGPFYYYGKENFSLQMN